MNHARKEPGRDLVRLTSAELQEVKVAARNPSLRQVIEATDERLIISPYPLRQTFKAVASTLRTRLYHGANPASPPIEDLPSGTIRGRRAFLEGTPSTARLWMGVSLLGSVLASWSIDGVWRVAARNGQVVLSFPLRTSLR